MTNAATANAIAALSKSATNTHKRIILLEETVLEKMESAESMSVEPGTTDKPTPHTNVLKTPSLPPV